MPSSVSRRGFLAALPALVAGVAVAKAIPEAPPTVSWANLNTAAPLTKAALEEAIGKIETVTFPNGARMYTLRFRHSIDYPSFRHRTVWNSGL